VYNGAEWKQIMLASYHGHAPLVKLLLEHGADPNSLNDRGQSPLAGAVFKGEDGVVEVSRTSTTITTWLTNIIQTLLEGGADPDHGAPSALEAIVLFKQQDKWQAKFEAALGRGKAA
jgi:ankyrin repeat protein